MTDGGASASGSSGQVMHITMPQSPPSSRASNLRLTGKEAQTIVALLRQQLNEPSSKNASKSVGKSKSAGELTQRQKQKQTQTQNARAQSKSTNNETFEIHIPRSASSIPLHSAASSNARTGTSSASGLVINKKDSSPVSSAIHNVIRQFDSHSPATTAAAPKSNTVVLATAATELSAFNSPASSSSAKESAPQVVPRRDRASEPTPTVVPAKAHVINIPTGDSTTASAPTHLDERDPKNISLDELPGVGAQRLRTLRQSNLYSVADLLALSDRELVAIDKQTRNINLHSLRKAAADLMSSRACGAGYAGGAGFAGTSSLTNTTRNGKTLGLSPTINSNATSNRASAAATMAISSGSGSGSETNGAMAAGCSEHSWFGREVSCFVVGFGETMLKCRIGKMHFSETLRSIAVFITFTARNQQNTLSASVSLIASMCILSLGRWKYLGRKSGLGSALPNGVSEQAIDSLENEIATIDRWTVALSTVRLSDHPAAPPIEPIAPPPTRRHPPPPPPQMQIHSDRAHMYGPQTPQMQLQRERTHLYSHLHPESSHPSERMSMRREQEHVWREREREREHERNQFHPAPSIEQQRHERYPRSRAHSDNPPRYFDGSRPPTAHRPAERGRARERYRH